MAQTQRLLSTIFDLLADNTTQLISPADLRDAIETLRNGHGEISVTSPGATTVAAVDTWYAAAGTFALTSPNHNWTLENGNQLTYGGNSKRLCHIAMSFSMTCASSSQVLGVAVGKNGSVITPSIIRRKIGTGSDVGAAAAHAFIEVEAGDYLQALVLNETSAANITLETCNLFVMDMPALT